MKYKIGEVSRFLNLSVQMIRYYEKCGVIEPQREGDGQYRYYTEMDIFLLFDAMRYKEWNINIKDIHGIVEEHYFDRLPEAINQFRAQLREEFTYKNLLYARVGEMASQLSLCRYNVGNYWIEEVPARRWLYSGIASGDQYQITENQADDIRIVYEPQYISFFDVLVEFPEKKMEDERENWWYSIEERYYSGLNLSFDCRSVPKQYCACTIINMGEVGEFHSSCVAPLLSYLSARGLEQTDVPYGIILGRGKENGRFCRLLKLYVPIKTL